MKSLYRLCAKLCDSSCVWIIFLWRTSTEYICTELYNGVFMLADIMASLYGRGVNNFSKSTRPRDMLFLLKDTSSIDEKKLFKACRSVRLSVPQSHYKGDTPIQSVKISTLYNNFVIDYCRDFSLILHVCTRPRVDSLVYQAWILLNYFL